MLGLNRQKTLYKIKAYHYKYIGTGSNIQNWELTPTLFKCNYSSSQSVDRVTTNQAVPIMSMTIQTESNIDFKRNDKVSINGRMMLVKDQVFENNPLTAEWTNKPQSFVKFIVLE